MERSEFLCLAIALLVAICSLLGILHQRPSRGEALRWGFASIVGFIVSFLCYFDVRTRLSEEPQRQYEESFRLETTARQLSTNGTVSITSSPDGAEIFVDSTGYGHAPALLKLKPGKHTVQLVLGGYKDLVDQVDVKGGSIVNVNGKMEK